MTQLALDLTLADSAVFDNFVVGDNGQVVVTVRDHALNPTHPIVWLWGARGSGKSHLLQAAAACAVNAGRPVAYLPLGMDNVPDPALLEGLESRALVCVDDIDRVAANHRWERALFTLFVALRDAGGVVLASATAGGPGHVPFGLPDLASRLASGPVFALQPLDDETRIAALRVRASARGLDLPDDVARYLMRHHRRDMATLYGLLDTLDGASLAAQRRLTVPFVRAVLELPG